MQLMLEVLSGGCAGRKVVLQAGQTLQVGRTEWADVAVPDDDSMSRVHFELHGSGTGFYIRDLDSMNGTYCNGREVGLEKVRDGDVIIAGATKFVVHIAERVMIGDKGAGESSRRPESERPGPPVPETIRLPPSRQEARYRETPTGNNHHGARAAKLARSLAQDRSLYLVCHADKVDVSQPEKWISTNAGRNRPACDPGGGSPLVILPAASEPGAYRLIEKAWGEDALICVYSTKEQFEVLTHLREFAATLRRPRVLASRLISGAREFIFRLFSRIEAVLLEADSPAEWLLFSKPSSNNSMGHTAFVRIARGILVD